MEQNLKEIFEKERLVNYRRRADHEDLFVERLCTELPVKNKNSFGILKIAASIFVFVSLGVGSYLFVNQQKQINTPKLVLSNFSTDLKEMESFYVNNINNTITVIKNNNYSQSMIDRYMKRFKILKEEHKSLITEIHEEGPSSMSINALIHNLKKQLELLQVLKVELEKLKIKNYETI